MPLIKKVRKRGVNMVIEANAEVLFVPGAPAANFTRSFSNKIRGAVIQAAPGNKRPRWAHYGKPLKRTIKASTSYDPAQCRAFAAVGSTAPYSAFVDQGTGIYGETGRGPYRAKLLPPTTSGGSDLLDWFNKPEGVIVRGQRPQFFFDAGLRAAFAAQGVPSLLVPGTGTAAMAEALASVPNDLTGFLRDTSANPAFRGQLEIWRKNRNTARDRKFRKRKSRAGVYGRQRTPEDRKRWSRDSSRRYRERMKDKNRVQTKPVDTFNQRVADERARFVKAARNVPGFQNLTDVKFGSDGRWHAIRLVRGPGGIARGQEIQGREIKR